MEAKILIRTPKGQATGTKEKLRKIIGIHKSAEVHTNKKTGDNEILWIVKGDTRRVMKAIDNTYKFNAMMNMVLNNHAVKKLVNRLLKEKDAEELYTMLTQQTEVEVIKEAQIKDLTKNKKGVFYKIRKRLGL
jgi:uncharacterized metal-binding protein